MSNQDFSTAFNLQRPALNSSYPACGMAGEFIPLINKT
jgi:hypothetical protein